MAEVVYLPEAEQDLYGIWRYVFEESRSLEVVDRLVDTIDDTCRAYAGQPELGQLRTDLDSRVRCFPVGNFVVFYVPFGEGIEVIQVIHGARGLASQRVEARIGGKILNRMRGLGMPCSEMIG